MSWVRFPSPAPIFQWVSWLSTSRFVSPAYLSLDDSGRLGVKTVGHQERTIAFNRVEIVEASRDGGWISGLPENVRLVTQGQGFVAAGETVRIAERQADHQSADRHYGAGAADEACGL